MFTNGYGVAWNAGIGGVFIPSITSLAVGSGTTNSIAYSNDGINWTGVPNSTNIFSSYGHGVAYNGTLWVAVGEGGNSIAYSSNGITWFPSTNGNSIFSTSGLDVAYNGTLWVAVGEGTYSIAYSYNGTTWLDSSNGNSIFSVGRGVAYNGTLWVAVGGGNYSIANSSDGITWTGVQDSSINIFTGGNSVAYNKTMWVAVGSGMNSIAYSYNGINWFVNTNGNSMFTLGHSVAWNGTRWVAGGTGTYKIAYSSDGITWFASTNGNSIFTYNVRGVAWNGTLWIAVGEGENRIAYSYDGITWTPSASGSTILTGNGYGVAGNANIASITLNKNGYGLSNKLDIVADKYYNKGYSNLTLSVNEIPNPTASITTTNANISPNGSTTITPQFTNGTTVTINGSSTINGQTIVSNTTYSVSPTINTSYNLVVINSIGIQQSDFVAINVIPNPTASITTTNANIASGGSTTITPLFTNGTTVTINGSNLTPSGQPIVSNTTYTVSPTMTTRYTLVVTNSIGVQQSASVTINVAPTGWYGTLYINNEAGSNGLMIFRLNVVNDGIETSLYNIDGGFDAIGEGGSFNIEVPQANRLTNISSRIKLIFILDGAQIGDIDVINIVNEGGGLYDAENNYYYLDFSIEEPYLNGETLIIDFLIIY